MRRPLAVAVPARAPMSKPEGPEGSVRAAFGHVRPIFIPVHLDGLVLDSVVDFHLHLQTSPGHFVLFRGPDLEFTTAHHRRLLANKVETLWLKGDERRRYYRITGAGRAAVATESGRLQRLVDFAQGHLRA